MLFEGHTSNFRHTGVFNKKVNGPKQAVKRDIAMTPHLMTGGLKAQAMRAGPVARGYIAYSFRVGSAVPHALYGRTVFPIWNRVFRRAEQKWHVDAYDSARPHCRAATTFHRRRSRKKLKSESVLRVRGARAVHEKDHIGLTPFVILKFAVPWEFCGEN